MKQCIICERIFADEVNFCEFDGSVLRDAQQKSDPFLGRTLRDRYRIIERIGHGSMSDVYLSEHLQIGRKVLLKVLSIQYASNEAFVRRFRQEAKLLSSLSHPRLIQLFDFDQAEDGSPYIVTEYVQGRSLKQILETQVLEIPRVIRFAAQLAEGLGAAHSAGVIHRDINPENIMVINEQDDIKITDFGFARSREAETTIKITQVGTILGNPSYIAPEQIEGYETDERTDIYSLGIVIYEMLCGVVPFTDVAPTAVWMKHLNDPPIPPTTLRSDIPREFEDIVLRALEKKPEHRWARMADVVTAVRNAGKELTREPRAQSVPAGRPSEPAQRSPQIERTEHKTAVQSTHRDVPNKRPDDTVSKTVVLDDFDSASLTSEHSESVLPMQNSISETMIMTQVLETVPRKRKGWTWIGLACALLMVGSLTAWFIFVSQQPNGEGIETPIGVSSNETEVTAPITSILLDIAQPELVVGERALLRLTARYADGSTNAVEQTNAVSWTSNNPSVAVVDAQGNIEAKDVGTAALMARYMGVEAPAIRITVKPSGRQNIAPPKILSIAIKGGRREIAPTDRLRLRLVGKDADGREVEIKTGVHWESAAPDIATVDSQGTIQAQRAGRVQLVARYGGILSQPFSLVINPSSPSKRSEARATKKGQAMKSTIVEERVKIARGHLDRGEYTEALNELAKASKIDPHNNDLHAAIANAKRACNAEKRLGRSDLQC